MSQDGRFWWNGTTWQPIVRRRQLPWAAIGLVVGVLVVFALVIHAFPRQLIDNRQYGATNARIDGPTLIEFDYLAQDSCSNLTFIYTFYDAQGIKVGEVKDSLARQVTASQSYHFTIGLSDPIEASATRFTATPNCS